MFLTINTFISLQLVIDYNFNTEKLKFKPKISKNLN